jgi:hypothetical protein
MSHAMLSRQLGLPSVWPYEKGSREFPIPLDLTEHFVA